ncbi:MAG: exo-alpha-sialidase [Opitutaceae bacterium]|nr:exo-alpha-sialidase [Cephaloticoccus sp.]MCP5530813.1 exo-alpha-sialidase [Opitutaceae bacterium]
MRLEWGDPVLVAESPFCNEPGVDRWGYYQFPVLDRLMDGRIAVTFHINKDSARAYGKGTDEPNRGVSADGGMTWTRAFPTDAVAGLVLPDGQRVRVGTADVTPRPALVADYQLPPTRGTAIGSYGQQPYVTYLHRELPAELQGVPLARWDAAAQCWQTERARLDDPDLLRASAEGVFPVVWWGDVNLAPDGSLIGVVYPARLEGTEFAHWHCGCYRSVDGGRSWQLAGRILYRPDSTIDCHAAQRDGFSEPASVILPDGELVAVLRTTDGNGDGPLYLCRSVDLGVTWTPPKILRRNGVLPRLLRLANGILVMSTGRPGADLSFSSDGRGETWSEPHLLVPITSDYNQHDSCGYTSLLALDDNAFLVAYSWFQKPAGHGGTRKAIYVRRVRVQP